MEGPRIPMIKNNFTKLGRTKQRRKKSEEEWGRTPGHWAVPQQQRGEQTGQKNFGALTGKYQSV